MTNFDFWYGIFITRIENNLQIDPDVSNIQFSKNIVSNCWVSPEGKVYICNYGQHTMYLAYLKAAKIINIKDELDADDKGWLEISQGRINILHFPVSDKVKNLIVNLFLDRNNKIIINDETFTNLDYLDKFLNDDEL